MPFSTQPEGSQTTSDTNTEEVKPIEMPSEHQISNVPQEKPGDERAGVNPERGEGDNEKTTLPKMRPEPDPEDASDESSDSKETRPESDLEDDDVDADV